MKRWLGLGNEDETPRDGPLSSWKEWHALMNGFFKGVYRLNPKPTADDSVEEPHYFRIGYLLGNVLQYVVLVVFASRVINLV